MRTARALPLLLSSAAGLCAGCVDRRFVIESNVPNAQVAIDNRVVGKAPVDAPFDYYGLYTVTLVHPNYAPVKKVVRVRAPWYAYPPFDFFAECVYPFRIEDVRRYYFEMDPLAPVAPGQLITDADILRQKGWALPPPSNPPLTPAGGLPPPAAAPLPAPTPLAPTPPPRPPGPTGVPGVTTGTTFTK